jgi:hypothetical protein
MIMARLGANRYGKAEARAVGRGRVIAAPDPQATYQALIEMVIRGLAPCQGSRHLSGTIAADS